MKLTTEGFLNYSHFLTKHYEYHSKFKSSGGYSNELTEITNKDEFENRDNTKFKASLSLNYTIDLSKFRHLLAIYFKVKWFFLKREVDYHEQCKDKLAEEILKWPTLN